MKTLSLSIRRMRKARLAYDDACRATWASLLATHPEVMESLKDWAMDDSAAYRWFCMPQFDGKSPAELIDEGRGRDVLERLDRMVRGIL